MKTTAGLPLALLAGSLISQYLGAAWAKTLFPLVGADGATGLRVGLSALLLALLFRPWRAPPTRAQLPALLIYGLMLGGMNLCIYRAMALIPIGIAVAVEVTGPLLIALLGCRRGRDLLWIALAVAGLWVLLPVGGAGDLNPVGLAYACGAAACWALYILAGNRASGGHAGRVVFWGMLVAAMFTVPIGIAAAGSTLLGPTILAAGCAVAALSSVLPYSLEIFALRRVPPRVFGLIVSASPAVAATLGVVLLGETLSVSQWIAIACIMAASAGSTLHADRRVP